MTEEATRSREIQQSTGYTLLVGGLILWGLAAVLLWATMPVFR